MDLQKPSILTPALLPEEVEFIQTIIIGTNGLSRGKLWPREKLDDLLNGKEEIYSFIDLIGVLSEVPINIKDLRDDHYSNKRLIPDPSSLRICHWIKDSSLAMMFFDIYDLKNISPGPINIRLLTKNKIKDLEEIGLQLFVGVENEFRLFDKITKKPWTNGIYFLDQFYQTTLLLPYARKLRKELKKIDIEFENCHFESGSGQVEVPLKVYSGIEAADKNWLFRQISKYVANEMGLIASYMTSPLVGEMSNGIHVNHSLWKKSDNGLINAMWNPEGDDELSSIGKYWLAGLIKHAKALTVFFAPTVNCYRRIRESKMASDIISWNYRDRTVGLRVKTSKEIEKANYIENRFPSSASNIYLVISGMIVAGMDGIKNKLELIQPGNGSHCEKLPTSLTEAFDALKQDKVLVDAFGEKFIDWFIEANQETELNFLKDVDIDIRTEDGIAKEFNRYLNL